jgi:alpha-glucosidase (family GH31 glycosyl hydrolase)
MLQAGAFQPFMRAHAHIDTRRREPYLYDPEDIAIIRDAAKARYSFLPYWYTVFNVAANTGLPVMRYCCQNFAHSSFVSLSALVVVTLKLIPSKFHTLFFP